ncbi:MAG TPA: hypothetical protein VM574_13720, partial [Terrimicrobiaceae bacterium]|nr:hypothetical protein [Terrimicrobiaceae bacterium]
MADETHNNPAASQGGSGRSGGERKSKAPAPKKKDSEAAAPAPAPAVPTAGTEAPKEARLATGSRKPLKKDEKKEGTS